MRRLVAQRLFGLALGYEDLNDHDELRDDSSLAVERDDLTGENRERDQGRPLPPEPAGRARRARPVQEDRRRRGWTILSLFLEAPPPKESFLDFDNTDDPLHGNQKDSPPFVKWPGGLRARRIDGACYVRLPGWKSVWFMAHRKEAVGDARSGMPVSASAKRSVRAARRCGVRPRGACELRGGTKTLLPDRRVTGATPHKQRRAW